MEADSFGIGLRPQLTPDILEHAAALDLVEIIADDLFRAPRHEIDALCLLQQEVRVSLHGVGLGLASAHAVDQARLDRFARLVAKIQPANWSEHLAFVRAGGFEIGHLAHPPRTRAVIEGAARNILAARRTIGSSPALENIATLIDPPCSEMSETEWLNAVLEASDCDMLLDLHNLYANAVNFGQDPFEMLAALNPSRISMIHLSGGCWIEREVQGRRERRLLDDHLHDPPAIVFDLLEAAASLVPRPVSVIIERDGRYPAFPVLLEQLERARQSVKRGRLGVRV